MARPRVEVSAPPSTPLPYGLLSAALVLDDLTGHAQMGVHYLSEACGTIHETAAACEADVPSGWFGGREQIEDGIGWVDGDPFALYSLVRCRLPGGSDIPERARETFRLAEPRGVERAVARRLALDPEAVDLTPTAGTAMHPDEGVALLEAYAAANYGGVPVLHLPRDVTALVEHVDRYGDHLETRQGARVASGGGYDVLAGPAVTGPDPDDPDGPPVATPVEAPEGTAWAYVTGQTVIRRAPAPEATPLVTTARVTNEGLVLTHRTYVVTWECVTAAVLVRTVGIGGAQ